MHFPKVVAYASFPAPSCMNLSLASVSGFVPTIISESIARIRIVELG